MKCPLKASVFFPSIIFISGWAGSSVLCAGFFSSCIEWRLLLATEACHRPLTVVALLSRSTGCSSCGSQALERGLSSCGSWTQLLHGMWNLVPDQGSNLCPQWWQVALIHCASREAPAVFLR